jgi:hypothetical protein
VTVSRSALAVSLAAATLVVVLATIAMGGALRAGLAPWPGLALPVMATAAFLLSRGRGSLLVAALLAASGLVSLVYGLVMTELLTAVVFPGPVLGVVAGLLVLALGVASARASGTKA